LFFSSSRAKEGKWLRTNLVKSDLNCQTEGEGIGSNNLENFFHSGSSRKKERAGDCSPARSSGVFGFFILRFVPAPGKHWTQEKSFS
jgi:hypothetical protein